MIKIGVPYRKRQGRGIPPGGGTARKDMLKTEDSGNIQLASEVKKP
jgi:hypothetical protein